MLGIIGAMDMEIEGLLARMTGVSARQIGYTKFYLGALEGLPVCLARCGVGKVHAALCAQAMLLSLGATEILNIGVAGALRDSLAVGDLVIAESAVQHDMDTTPVGDPLGLISGPNLVHLPCDAALTALLEKAAEAAGLRAQRAAVATGDQFIAALEKKDFLAASFNAAACDMEGGAIAQACYEMGAPYAACRAISDTRRGDGREYLLKAREACQAEERLLAACLPLYRKEREENG